MTGDLVAEHFKPLKGTIAEVDGQPPALDAAVVALTALSNQLQLVLAKPNANEEIKKLGGLAELTGAVARQATSCPTRWTTGWLASPAMPAALPATSSTIS